MWSLAEIFPLLFLAYFGTTLADTQSCNPASCKKEKDVEKVICGSDGITYPNRCIFEKIRCQDKNLALIRRGPCKPYKSCSEIMSVSRESAPNQRFVPACRSDGTFDSEQCYPGISTCWCVTPEGVPLPYTSRKRRESSEKPRCHKRKKALKRSTAKNAKHKIRICKRPDKSAMNNNLINSFHSEFSRYFGRNDSDVVVITWKFRVLDRNNDERLDKTEYKDLKKIVKKAIKPKKCAKMFPRNCDVDRNGIITLQEWDECITRDGMDDGRSQISTEDNEDNDDYDDHITGRLPPHGVLSSEMTTIGSYDDESMETIEDPTDCLSDRKTALSEGSQLYVPECTPDGRYQKIQCYKSAGYCWCVNEDTGKNIPGTSVKNGTPKCDYPKTTVRVMKGCPDEKKTVFLKELLNFLHTGMMTNDTDNPNSLVPAGSKEEQAAVWSFSVFDKNKNKMMERSEWKAFKEMVGRVKGLRKCGKKLPRYCDSNKDRQISMTEWLECLKIQQGDSPLLPFPMSPRAGKINPLSMLKDD